MFRSVSFSVLISSIVLSQSTFADCNSPLDNTALTTLFSTPKIVCVANSNGWEHQEEHIIGGALYDYKLGPSNAIDPRENIGSWSISGNTITYNYLGGSSFSSTLGSNGGESYTFCANSMAATIKPNTNSGC